MVITTSHKSFYLYPYSTYEYNASCSLGFGSKKGLIELLVSIYWMANGLKAMEVRIAPLKRQCHESFSNFFLLHESNPFGSLINSLKWLHWKIRFRKDIHENRDPCRVILSRAVSHCAESDSMQYHTAPSREIEMSENPKLCNTAVTTQSRTPRSVILRRVKQFIFFLKTYISMTFRIYVMIFRKNSKIFRKSKNG